MTKRVTTRKRLGRPTAYKPEYVREAHNLCLLGATTEDLARVFGVGTTTIERWTAKHPEFRGALKSGRDEADANVAKRLYSRALGYSHKAVKIFWDAKTNTEKVIEYTEHYPPDATSMIFWLKNRRPDVWRDRSDVRHEGLDTLADALRAAEARHKLRLVG